MREEPWLPGDPPARQPYGVIRGLGEERSGGRALPSRHGRQLFPLPCMDIPCDKSGACRTVTRRRQRIQHMTENVNTVIRSMNWLAGCKNDRGSKIGAFPDDSPSVPCSQMQEEVLARLEGLVHDQKPSGAKPVPQAAEALRELLRGASPYDGQSSNECLASYKAELVSVPDDTRGCPQLVDVGPPDDRRYLEEGSELMIKPQVDMPDVQDLPVPYWDPKLKYNRKEYNRLVVVQSFGSRLHNIGFFNYTLSPKCHVGVFFVWKSNRTKLRLISDARRSNAHFVEPPGVQLVTAEGLGKIEIELEGDIFHDIKAVEQLASHWVCPMLKIVSIV